LSLILLFIVAKTLPATILHFIFSQKIVSSSSLVLWFRNMLPLRVEPSVGVRGVVYDLQLASLVIVPISAMNHSCIISLLVPELSVVTAK